MLRSHRSLGIRSTLLMLVTLASAACSNDAASPVAPGATSTATPNGNVSFGRTATRVPYISNLQLASEYVTVNTGYTTFTVTVTNPTTTDFGKIFLRGELKAQIGQAVPATAFMAYCPSGGGVVPPGDCVMSNGIQGVPTLALGPGTYTLQVLQEQKNGTMKVLDSKTVDVVLAWLVQTPR